MSLLYDFVVVVVAMLLFFKSCLFWGKKAHQAHGVQEELAKKEQGTEKRVRDVKLQQPLVVCQTVSDSAGFFPPSTRTAFHFSLLHFFPLKTTTCFSLVSFLL